MTQVQRYRSRISGPLLDRIDIQIEVPRLSFEQMQGGAGETSTKVRVRVAAARQRQLDRSGMLNSELTNPDIDAFCGIDRSKKRLLQEVTERFGLSPRAYHRVLKVARTVADLAGSKDIATAHLSEAIGYRCLDRAPTR